MRHSSSLVFISALALGCSEYKFGSDSDLPSSSHDLDSALPEIEVEPSVIDYGIVEAGEIIEEIVTIRNIGEETLHLDDVFLDLNNGLAYSFTLIDPFAWDLDPGIVTFVNVSITGPEDTVRLGRLRVDSDDPYNPKAQVQLRHDLPDEDAPPEEPPPDEDPPDEDDPPGDPPDDDPPPSDPPPEEVDDCEGDVDAEFIGSEIYVLSWDRNTDSGSIVAAEPGWYHIYDTALSESGASQFNETAYLRITNSFRPDGEPYFANCGDDWVVQDADNFGSLPGGARLYAGTFWLEAGENIVTMYHYCPLYRSGACPSLHFTDDPSGTCDSDNANSVHYGGYGICLRRME